MSASTASGRVKTNCLAGSAAAILCIARSRVARGVSAVLLLLSFPAIGYGANQNRPAPSLPASSAVYMDAAPTSRPDNHPTIQESIDKGVAFLVKTQNPDGSWGTGKETRGFEIYSMVPGSIDAFRIATTGLCVMALREAGEKPAHERGVRYLIEHTEAGRDDGALMYNTWAHIYGLQALAIELRVDPDSKLHGEMKKAAERHIDRLAHYETYMGGWNYYDFHAHTEKPSMGPTSFGTSAGVVALWEAKQAGLAVPREMIDRALHRLAEMHLPNGAYLYGSDYQYIPRLPANQPRGSVGRTQAANFALWLWKAGGIDKAKVREGLAFFFKEHMFIEMGRQRQYPHEAWYQTAPYYYYFGHYYAARLLEKLDDPQTRPWKQKLAEEDIIPHQEDDGSWWDFAMWDFHKPYGTAFAIMTLLRCQ